MQFSTLAVLLVSVGLVAAQEQQSKPKPIVSAPTATIEYVFVLVALISGDNL